ncbi:MAG: hypothetical protein IPP46_12725 [Bacteroidetes bacterium]|nr:hypothetical protein [Bacteroidota bacterium]
MGNLNNKDNFHESDRKWLEVYETYRITDKIVLPPVPVVSINGEIISTEGNLTTISGGSKDGKVHSPVY